MTPANTPQKTLESWKQIAAYLDRSERTVRRWEAQEGLPVHRRAHEKQDTVFAYRHELEAWRRLRTRFPAPVSQGSTGSNGSNGEAGTLHAVAPLGNTHLAEHDAITRTMH